MAETERENIRKATLEGLDAAARKGNYGGRPQVITDDMLHTVLRRRAAGEPVETIRTDLIIPAGKRKGHLSLKDTGRYNVVNLQSSGSTQWYTNGATFADNC